MHDLLKLTSNTICSHATKLSTKYSERQSIESVQFIYQTNITLSDHQRKA